MYSLLKYGTEELLCCASMTPGFTRNSAPSWARGQDAFLEIQGLRVHAPSAAIVCRQRSATVQYMKFIGNLKRIYEIYWQFKEDI